MKRGVSAMKALAVVMHLAFLSSCAAPSVRPGGCPPEISQAPMAASPTDARQWQKTKTSSACYIVENPDAECKNWSAALELAKKMAGCDPEFRDNPEQQCQVAIRRCSPGCNVCANLKPGGGADTDFGPVRQPPKKIAYATTYPGFFSGYYSRFDPSKVCGDDFQLARVMVHEAVHACKLAGGANASFDSYDYLRRCADLKCCTYVIAPVNPDNKKECGD